MLGILDSGLGGLSVLQRVRARLPHEDIVYFADQANSPLGVRPAPVLAGVFQRYVTRLEDLGVDGIAMGSNTLCAISREFGWPRSRAPMVDMIQPTAAAVAETGKRSVGVIATGATVRSGVYGEAIREAYPAATVQEVAASELVDLVEAGFTQGERVLSPLRKVLSDFSSPVDLLVLGCTHFTWLDSAIAEVFGPKVMLLDPADIVSAKVAALRSAADESVTTRRGITRFMTTGDVALFKQNIENLMGALHMNDTVVQTHKVDIGD